MQSIRLNVICMIPYIIVKVQGKKSKEIERRKLRKMESAKLNVVCMVSYIIVITIYIFSE